MSLKPLTPRSLSAAFREAARRIAEKKSDFISWEPDAPRMAALPSEECYKRLEEIVGGEMIWFDDPEFRPTDETRNQRVVFLCFAAAIEASHGR